MLEITEMQSLLEATILAANKPMTEEDLLSIFQENERPSKGELRKALRELASFYENRGIHLLETASGYQFQVNIKWAPYIGKMWEEKPARYSRAFFETLALIAYRQPITRSEIEDIRGVSLSPSIFKTMLEEREWIRVVGHKDVPGKPALYATTKTFLDYFGLKSLEELPPLPEIMNLGEAKIEEEVPQQLEMDVNVQSETQEEAQDEEIQEEIAEDIEAMESTIDAIISDEIEGLVDGDLNVTEVNFTELSITEVSEELDAEIPEEE